jgi:tRNA(Ile)-lysidine synthase TilS/MesJ
MERNPDKLPTNTKCSRCRGQATIRMPSHHANFCPPCFIELFTNAVRKAMKKFAIPSGAPLMVAVSGGKDSLALWDVLSSLGYTTKGLHIDLGISGFSQSSLAAVARFAEVRKLVWSGYSLKSIFGYDLTEVRKRSRRKPCAVCGMLKRQLLNRLAIQEGFNILALGHNLDDEAGRLLGNILRHRTQYLHKQAPFLPSSHPRLPARAKPLYRLDARDIAIYCGLRGVEPVESSCPLAHGATSHIFKEALELLEAKMPATKRDFLFTFLDRRAEPDTLDVFGTCRKCGGASYGDLCAVCNLADQMKTGPTNDNDSRPVRAK